MPCSRPCWVPEAWSVHSVLIRAASWRLSCSKDQRMVSPLLAIGRLVGGLFGLLALFDDVAVGEQHLLHRRLPLRRAAEQELEVHSEVLELLLLRVLHDRAGLVVGL